jgi:hypothetical protein
VATHGNRKKGFSFMLYESLFVIFSSSTVISPMGLGIKI